MIMNSAVGLPLLAALFVSLGAFVIPFEPAGAAGDWRNERNAAGLLDTKGQHMNALTKYEAILKSLPPTAVDAAIEIKALTAADYLRTDQFARAKVMVDDLLKQARPLIAARTLSPDAAEAIRALVEECESSHAVRNPNIAAQAKRWHEYQKLATKICEEALPQLLTVNRIMAQARGFIALGDRVGCLEYLQHHLHRFPANTPGGVEFRIKIAVLKNLDKQPAELNALRAELLKKYNPISVAIDTVKAQTWVADYNGARKTATEGLKQFDREKSLNKAYKIELLYAYMVNALDSGSNAEALGIGRQLLALNPPEGEFKFVTMRSMIACLKQEHKMKEAAALEAQMPKSNYSFLEEDEREAVEEIKRKHKDDPKRY